jgi:hypothetical protein
MHTLYLEILRRKSLLGGLSVNEKVMFKRVLMEIEVKI